jgi:serine protease Do
MEPGDVIVQYNGRPVGNNDELVKMVVATKPGTSVQVKVLRNKQEKTLNAVVDELDLDAEQNQTRRGTPQNDQPAPEEQATGSFGVTLEPVTPQLARRLHLPSGRSGAVVTEVDPDGASAGALRPGDVILSVNGRPVSNAVEAARELQQVQTGRIAQMRVWRGDAEVFVPVKKE